MTPDFIVANYKLVRLLGSGGFGDVWLASDLRADRLVALKFIKPGLLDTPEFRTRFLLEARTLGRLEHDRIVPLYTVLEDSGHLALVLRFIEGLTPGKGTSLADYIDERGALPLSFVHSSARDILPALGFAHDRGVIHRDMKPQNILLDSNVRSFLTDFGIAVVEFAERGTMTGSMIGTPHYMSPEQILDSRQITVENKGRRSDIYSYGVVLYEMLTGRVPFGADSGVEETFKVQRAHCDEPPPPLRDINPEVPASVENAVLRCLAKSPDDRPQTCAELLWQFDAAVAQRPGYAPTVVEKRAPGAQLQRLDPKPVTPAVHVPARRAVPKAAWLGAGGVLIAAGITFGIVTGNKRVTPPVPAPTGSTGPTATSGGADAGRVSRPGPQSHTGVTAVRPPNQPPIPDIGKAGATAPTRLVATVTPPAAMVGLTPAQQQAAEQDYAQASDFLQKKNFAAAQSAIEAALAIDSSNSKYLNLKGLVTQGLVNVQEARDLYNTAKLQLQQGDNCEGVPNINRAVEKDSKPEYLSLQKTLKTLCDHP